MAIFPEMKRLTNSNLLEKASKISGSEKNLTVAHTGLGKSSADSINFLFPLFVNYWRAAAKIIMEA